MVANSNSDSLALKATFVSFKGDRGHLHSSESKIAVSENQNSVPPLLASSDPPFLPPVLAASATAIEAPLSDTARWRKRLLLIAFGISLLAGIGWATSPRAKLLHKPESISSSFDTTIQSVAQRVDQAMNADIASHGLAKAKSSDWRAVTRRISLGLIGNGLSLEEIRVVEQIPEDRRPTWWTEYLLKDRRSSDYLAERWTRATVGTNVGPFLIFRRRKYVDWIADHFEKGTPYDVIVRDILEAKGSWTDAPQVNFLTATMDDADNKKPDAIRLAGRTSRAFLAQRIDCLQCHADYLGKVNFSDSLGESSLESDDPSVDPGMDSHAAKAIRTGEQADFHQLAAFFSGTRLDNPFVGLRNFPPDYRMTYLNDEKESSVEPTVPYLRELMPESGDPRHRLAVWVTHPKNKAFARATVNRMWAILFGKPLVEPLDSIPLSGPFPVGLEILAEDLATNGYDLKRLIRTIVCTEAFQRDSRLEQENGNESIEKEHENHWAVFPLTQLRPEQVAASIHQACRIHAIDENSSIISKLELFGGVNDFTKAYGDQGDDEFIQQSVTIPQRLLVMNGSYVSERIKNNPIMNAATRIAQLASNDKVAVETAYLSTLNRLPTGTELNAFCARLHDTKANARSQAMGSIFWTLINSTEFQWNH